MSGGFEVGFGQNLQAPKVDAFVTKIWKADITLT
jgi:hypothetical protein